MTTLTIAAAELCRIVLAVEKSAAKDDARPVLPGIHAEVTAAYATLGTPVDRDAPASPYRAFSE
jgi:hypothetical protein